MDDPFAKAKSIRKGELDAELPHYEEMTGWFQRCPISHLPGLLIAVVAQCVIRKVFVPGKLLPFVQRAEAEAGDPNSFLREQPAPPPPTPSVRCFVVKYKTLRPSIFIQHESQWTYLECQFHRLFIESHHDDFAPDDAIEITPAEAIAVLCGWDAGQRKAREIFKRAEISFDELNA